MVLMLDDPVAKKKKPDETSDVRDRVDLRVDPELYRRLFHQSRRHGLSMSSYVRLAVTKQLEMDESTEPVD